MARYDLKRLRTDQKITQKELADRLKVTQGFLSSVEKWRNPFPDDRIDDLQKVFPDVDLTEYEVSEEDVPRENVGSFNRHSEIDINDSKLLLRLLDVIGKSTTSLDDARSAESEETTDWRRRYDKLNDKYEELRAERDSLLREKYELRDEIFRLRELLMKNNIDYEEKK